MPLRSGSSKAAVRGNIATLIREGREPAQAAAIAYRKAGKSKKRPAARARVADYIGR